MSKLSSRLLQLKNALRYLARGDFAGLLGRIKWYGREYSHIQLRKRLVNGNGILWGILCTPHTVFIAQAIAKRLAHHGIDSEILTDSTKSFPHDFYIVLCAQMFKRLPPASKRVIFQLEQSVSSRWFTSEYIKTLNDSFGVLEYSLTNIEFLARNGIEYPKVHYLPIGASLDQSFSSAEAHKEYDFIFYGDSLSSERRRKFIKKLQENYRVKVCNNLFGSELYAAIRKAKAVINIHYYDDALLEMPRICECISLGIPVLSEGTADQEEYPELKGAVKFFDQNSIESMIACAASMMSNHAIISESVEGAVFDSSARFNFMLDRFLLAIGVVPASIVLDEPVYVSQKSNFYALSLPETIERRRGLNQSLPEGCTLFDGIRHVLGWIGCAASFKALSRYALANNIDRLTVIEDDVDLPGDFDSIYTEVNEYLDSRKTNWDIFSGLMADVHPSAKILSVDEIGSRTYVTIDKMTSTVFNIYNKTALEIMSNWDSGDTDAITNTIDRYLERRAGLRVVVALPFVAGHKEDAKSTLWGIENDRYTPMIAEAQHKIETLVRDWRLRQK
ncbi:methyltransferase type 11 [Ochrobactrum sp. 30A/1000/2015]|nr:methyltransferase type 11 [Ochrobactrum sp. 30A/1000/2015]PJT36911.1 methyltransferase type 11 [Ochrobactrum sp. 27A/999/2015]PJT41785.1 methyltransferase type 11 [Ochrobactrum sp. 23A/997/2015]